MRTIAGLWRWRGNPLCRATDRREAWLALCAVLVIALGAPLAGLLSAHAAGAALHRAAHEQQRDRQRVWATVVDTVHPRPPLNAEPESVSRQQDHRRVRIRWKDARGHPHTGSVPARRAVRPGARLRVWTDRQGRLSGRPLSPRGASSHALLAGLAAGAGVAAGVEALRRLALRGLLRRRYTRWGEEWDRVGPDWGRPDWGRADSSS
ncbi:hypothetical protein [Streptomyces boncukensis]|uniref:Integral membrane protein n=1 Tax=Streptomyces boncukensis TaxID=2711219 RepID=A0A6G4X1N5_9ACTN|nr:hypothetical protein [Streptomyces boncukensis]NGO70571.1 hypothetical protein [Streptomyces boncukensis]